MKIAISFYEKVSILSLDVVAGTMCCSAMFARQMHVSLLWQQYFVLASSVWIIYTIDHLLDALHKPILISPRHQFHKHYGKLLFIMCLILILITSCIAFVLLPVAVIWFGITLGGAMIVYLILTHFFPLPYFFKEGWVALLYTIGVWGSVAVQATSIRRIDWIAGFVFGILILQQAMLLAWYEANEDAQQQMSSLIQRQNTTYLHLFLKVLILAGLGVTLAGAIWLRDTYLDRWVWLTLGGIATLLTFITFFPRLFRHSYTYRLLSDGILMLPLWIVMVTW